MAIWLNVLHIVWRVIRMFISLESNLKQVGIVKRKKKPKVAHDLTSNYHNSLCIKSYLVDRVSN